MTPTVEQVRLAVERHCQCWNERRQTDWAALFAADVTFDDPVGSPTKHGAEAVRASWESSLTAGRTWHLVPTQIIVCADEAAVVMRNEGMLHGRPVEIDSIEVWRVGADGLVRSVRAYFTPVAEVHTEYFAGDRPDEAPSAEPSSAVDSRR